MAAGMNIFQNLNEYSAIMPMGGKKDKLLYTILLDLTISASTTVKWSHSNTEVLEISNRYK